MKNLILYPVAMSLILVCFASCTSDRECPSNLEETNVSKLDSTSLQELYVNHSIKGNMAYDELADYKTYIDTVMSDLQTYDPEKYGDVSTKLIYGAKIDLVELLEILHNADLRKGDALYIMNGIKDNATDMIFALEQNDGTTWEYFDFTQPCPTGCPNNGIYPLER